MKKIFVMTSVLALAACGNTVKEMDAYFTGCERVDTTKTHLVYKCPSSQEWIVALKGEEANGKFQEIGGLILDEIIADKENTYVEVVLGDSNNCKENFHIRTMIKHADNGNGYAFIGCK